MTVAIVGKYNNMNKERFIEECYIYLNRMGELDCIDYWIEKEFIKFALKLAEENNDNS